MPFDPSCIDVEDFLFCLEIRNVEKATQSEFRFSCPYPTHVYGDKSPSAYMNIYTTAFHCQSCKTSGNAITFSSDVLGVSPIVAIRMLKQRYGRGGLDPDSRSMVEELQRLRQAMKVSEPRKNRVYDESVLGAYRVNWYTEKIYMDNDLIDVGWSPYMFNRGFTAKMLTEWEFGYADWCDRITLPIRDEHGQLVGIKARAWDDRQPKYLNLRDKENSIEPYFKNDVVFALDRVDPDEDHLIVVEGEFNAIFMHEYGYKNTVAINGSYFGSRQMKLIKQAADRVTLFFDSDPAGIEATKSITRELIPFMWVDVCQPHTGDPAVMHPYTIERYLSSVVPARMALMKS